MSDCASAGAGVEGDVRLAEAEAGGAPGTVSGFLEVFHAGAWGSLCLVRASEGACYYTPEAAENLLDSSFVPRPPVLSQARSAHDACAILCHGHSFLCAGGITAARRSLAQNTAPIALGL